MITRLYVNNFKTLVNFELPLGPMNLLLGANGSGKSNVLEAIRLLRNFVCQGATTSALFPSSSLCRWDARNVQTLEIDLRAGDGTYRYRLEIEHGPERPGLSRIKSEQLSHNQETLYTAEGGKGQLGQSGRVLLAADRSGIGVVQDDRSLAGFVRQMRHGMVASSQPKQNDRQGRKRDTLARFGHVELCKLVSASSVRSIQSCLRIDRHFEE